MRLSILFLIIIIHFIGCTDGVILSEKYSAYNYSEPTAIFINKNLRDTTIQKHYHSVFIDSLGYFCIGDLRDTGILSKSLLLQKSNVEIWSLDNVKVPQQIYKLPTAFKGNKIDCTNRSLDVYHACKSTLSNNELLIDIYRNKGNSRDNFFFHCSNNKVICYYQRLRNGKLEIDPASIMTDSISLELNHYPVEKGDTLLGRFSYLGIWRNMRDNHIRDYPYNCIGWFKCVVE
jgi:hypothetical protein